MPRSILQTEIAQQAKLSRQMELTHVRSGRPALHRPGMTYGELTLLSRKYTRGIFECSCGNIVELTLQAVIHAGKRDCGHVAAEQSLDLNQQKGNMLYHTWMHMIARCEDIENPNYKDYGGRGIKVCDRWHDYENFVSDLGLRPEGTTLDRIDVDGNYEPSNCRWATATEQALNKRKKETKRLTEDL